MVYFSKYYDPLGGAKPKDIYTSAPILPFGQTSQGVIYGNYPSQGAGNTVVNLGFTYKNGQFISYNPPFGDLSKPLNTQIEDVNNSGTVVGFDYEYVSSSPSTPNFNGFVYKNFEYKSFNVPYENTGTTPGDVNDRGDVVGTFRDAGGVGHGFIFRDGNFNKIDNPLANTAPTTERFQPNGTYLSGINNVGDIVGSYIDKSNLSHGFIYKNGVFTTLDVPKGTAGTILTNITDNGYILGSYYTNFDANQFNLTNGGAFIYKDGITWYLPQSAQLVSGLSLNDNGVVFSQLIDPGSFKNLATQLHNKIVDIQGQSADQIYRLYDGFFDRLPDEGGFRYWVGTQQQDKLSEVSIANLFINSSEYAAKFGYNPTTTEFITTLYWNVLGRAPDTSGLDYWNQQSIKGVTKADIIVSFVESPENIVRIAPQIDNGYWVWG